MITMFGCTSDGTAAATFASTFLGETSVGTAFMPHPVGDVPMLSRNCIACASRCAS